MNLLHLKYAVEIAKAKSISKAAENLYMAQPNLSRAIKELEESLGITLFERTTKGITITPKGKEFLNYAEKILKQIDDIEAMFKEDKDDKQRFSVSVPRASYIAHAFTQFSKKIDPDKPAELFYKETNSDRAIKNILYAGYNLGILRYSSDYNKYFNEMLDEKNFYFEILTEFTYVVVMSKHHPLASMEELNFSDLTPYIEIAHADPFVPSLPLSVVKKEELPDNIQKRIFVFERASQFTLLSNNHNTFMWVSPLTDDIMEKYGLIQKRCPSNTKVYKDVLIYLRDYRLSNLDNLFIEEVYNATKKFI
ncbi:MAG: LysR family transcriptional regulator [Bacillota bacterium]|nr:LysR family transcriptional regulator [Bacillota bacterium]